MENQWYVLKRNDEEMIISVAAGCNPLYGYGSWDLKAGPFASFEDAESA